MKAMKTICWAFFGLYSAPALAQHWDPLSGIPHPNVLVGLDTSVTMGINAYGSCDNCHVPNRLDHSQVDIQATLPLFKDYFQYYGFTYAGCGSARITGRTYPMSGTLDDHYNATVGLLSAADNCGSKERRLPGGSRFCLVPTANCNDDSAKKQEILNSSSNPSGLVVPNLYVGTVTCDNGGPISSFDVNSSIDTFMASETSGDWVDSHRFIGTGGNNVHPDSAQAFCDLLGSALSNLRSQLGACLLDPNNVVGSSGTIDLSFLDGPQSAWCNQGQLINSICAAGSWAYGTCLCPETYDTDPLCYAEFASPDACGTPYQFRAREQVAICETHQDTAGFGTVMAGQSDNRVNGGCRENVAVLLTDGYHSGAHTQAAANLAIPHYKSAALNESNMYVFNVSNASSAMVDHANALSNQLSEGLRPTAPLANNTTALQIEFAKVLNGVYRGVYLGGNNKMDEFGTRLAVVNFQVVPGDYLGWPSRLSWYSINPSTGAVNATPVFETDWATVAGPLNASQFYLCPGSTTLQAGVCVGGDANLIGPNGSFRNGFSHGLGIPANMGDRNGDGTPDTHPNVVRGWMFGAGHSAPVIVEAPRTVPVGASELGFMAFQNDSTIANRPRTVYVASSGYLHAFHAGSRIGSGSAGAMNLKFRYNDNPSTTNAGREIFRYRPPWLETMPNYNLNDLVQQRLSNGGVTVSEAHWNNAGTATDYKTVLVWVQGGNGRGMSALDVSNPTAPTVLAEQTFSAATLPASTEPAWSNPSIVQWPRATTAPRPVAVVSTRDKIFAWDLKANTVMTKTIAGKQFPNDPVCVDVLNKGYVTHCYVLARTGELYRIPTTTAGFGAHAEIGADLMGGGREYWTPPVVFFTQDNAVGIVAASGNAKDWASGASASNRVVKLIDRFNRVAGPAPSATSTNVCGNSNTSGVINIGSAQVLSPPVLSRGTIAWTTFSVGSSGCDAGTSSLYAMQYEKCTDVLNPVNALPQAQTLSGDGIAASPMIHAQSRQILTQTTKSPTAAQGNTNAAAGVHRKTDPFRLLFLRNPIRNP